LCFFVYSEWEVFRIMLIENCLYRKNTLRVLIIAYKIYGK